MNELILLMPPHATPKSVRSLEAARQALRAELQRVERYLEAHTRSV